LPGGRKERVPAGRIAGIETRKNSDHQNADQLLAEQRFADALISYRRAVDQDQRTWMRRIILGQMVCCYRNQGQIASAAETFLIIVRSDPETQLFAVIPLSWSAHQPNPELARRSVVWCDDQENPVAALLGASWLLSSAQRAKAISVLQRLAAESPTPVVWLAETQLWRTKVVTARSDELPGWQKLINSLPDSLRAGPYFVLGRALAQQKDHEQAALAFMRIPILFEQDRDLAAEALLHAGEQLERTNQIQQARKVYEELVSRYKGHELVPIAQERLDRG
jgi:tetratricopeptide (TPR) repeat protein